eukprot:scpid88071/ scgid7283/ Mannose-binding protein A; Mannan-binding protein; Ra-reactive factor polysaccharide-binding component p28B
MRSSCQTVSPTESYPVRYFETVMEKDSAYSAQASTVQTVCMNVPVGLVLKEQNVKLMRVLLVGGLGHARTEVGAFVYPLLHTTAACVEQITLERNVKHAARNHCRPKNPCAHGGKCRSLPSRYICDCPRGYAGKMCQDHLLTSQELDERFSRLENAILNLSQSLRVHTEQRRFPAGIWLFSDHVTWFAARAKCIALGGVLAVPRSSWEHSEVRRLAQQQRYNGFIWIGASDRLYEGRWRDLEGDWLRYSQWNPGEPNDYHGIEDCAAMRGNGLPWFDLDCGRVFPFICRFP